jgi:hypothetical protein
MGCSTSRADGGHVTTPLIHRQPDPSRELRLDTSFVRVEVIEQQDAAILRRLFDFLHAFVSQNIPILSNLCTYPIHLVARPRLCRRVSHAKVPHPCCIVPGRDINRLAFVARVAQLSLAVANYTGNHSRAPRRGRGRKELQCCTDDNEGG